MLRIANMACSRRAASIVVSSRNSFAGAGTALTQVCVIDLAHAEQQRQPSALANAVLCLLLVIAHDAEQAHARALELAQRLGLDPRRGLARRALILVDPVRPGQESCDRVS